MPAKPWVYTPKPRTFDPEDEDSPPPVIQPAPAAPAARGDLNGMPSPDGATVAGRPPLPAGSSTTVGPIPGPPPGTEEYLKPKGAAPVVGGGYLGTTGEAEAAARAKRMAAETANKSLTGDARPATLGAPVATPEQANTAKSVEVSRGVGASMRGGDKPVDFGAEDWRGGAARPDTRFADFQASEAPRPSDFVSFSDFAATMDDPMRERAASAVQSAQAGGERARKAFSSALGQAGAGSPVEKTASYSDFLREQGGAEGALGSALAGLGASADPMEEALRRIYRQQLSPVSDALKAQREAAGSTASERNEANAAAAKTRSEQLPFEPKTEASSSSNSSAATRAAPPPPKREAATVQAIPVEQPMTDEERAEAEALHPSWWQELVDASGGVPEPGEYERMLFDWVKQNRAAKRVADQIQRTTPGKL